jgi:hypothetical protein
VGSRQAEAWAMASRKLYGKAEFEFFDHTPCAHIFAMIAGPHTCLFASPRVPVRKPLQLGCGQSAYGILVYANVHGVALFQFVEDIVSARLG